MYVQEIKTGQKFLYRGRVETVESVRLITGHHVSYEIKTETGRKIRYYAGDKITAA